MKKEFLRFEQITELNSGTYSFKTNVTGLCPWLVCLAHLAR